MVVAVQSIVRCPQHARANVERVINDVVPCSSLFEFVKERPQEYDILDAITWAEANKVHRTVWARVGERFSDMRGLYGKGSH